MPRFHELTVTAIERTIRDAVVVTLRPPEGADFTFRPGQYLTFRRDFDGQEIRRTYSICSGLDDGLLQVGIKRVEGGAFSTFANADLRVGDTLQAMPPMGRFTVDIDPAAAHRYLAFAGGSGITPLLSLTRSILAREPESRVTLVYANRSIASIMFREEIEDLKNLHMGRLRVIHVLEHDAQDIELFTGRVTEEKCAGLFASWIDVGDVDMALICGPEPMMQGVARALEAHGLDRDRIRFELFSSAAQQGRLPRPVPTSAAASAGGGTLLHLTLDGATREIVIPPGMTVLEAALAQDIEVPYSCRAGVCSTCRCRVTEGEVEMAANHALEDYEVARGYALSCQSFPLGGRLAVDYDQ
ncbi:2Fe-2S iron-sulfur cluster-binding protein [Roseibacterium sp. SDUM158017]|uniref:2Fe-2S iron-sulfur cluster-binding protein n=1 Tax=Roseicyclus salinarum TaxID=3036773 RepID=UPI0024154790|nr:2Fe-2S iron-sulfur cluster-binding protein [Roseibacterium sp. SDUM158017]MDG4648910.1 2Fe-2S iron-sulfur cluster-binding protein [Roseibacterium sp. SDUM158017]